MKFHHFIRPSLEGRSFITSFSKFHHFILEVSSPHSPFSQFLARTLHYHASEGRERERASEREIQRERERKDERDRETMRERKRERKRE